MLNSRGVLIGSEPPGGGARLPSRVRGRLTCEDALTSPDSHLQTDVLEELRGAHRYRNWLCQLASPWLGEEPLEIGSGLGDYAQDLAELGHSITASEADPSRLAYLQGRFAGHDRVDVRHLSAPVDEDADHSAVVAFNVLEHIEDDVAALRSFARLVRPGGHVVIIVPAFEFAMSEFDRAIGHVRRYRQRTLVERLAAAQLDVQVAHYVNMPGLLGWFVLVRLLGGRPKEGLPLRVFERVVPTLAAIEARWRPPFGQSVFAVARTPTT